MKPEELESQIFQCRDYIRKGGDLDFWLNSKDFQAEDEVKIREFIGGKNESS